MAARLDRISPGLGHYQLHLCQLKEKCCCVVIHCYANDNCYTPEDDAKNGRQSADRLDLDGSSAKIIVCRTGIGTSHSPKNLTKLVLKFVNRRLVPMKSNDLGAGLDLCFDIEVMVPVGDITIVGA